MSKTTTVEVTFPYTVERDGWHDEPAFGGIHCYGVYEHETELRALVHYYGPSEEPEVEPLEPAHWADQLGQEVLIGGPKPERNPLWVGAEEAALDAGYEKLRALPTAEDLADEAGDRAYDEQRDWEMLAGAAS